MSAARTLFKSAAPLLDLIDEIVPAVSNHEYTFVSDEWFQQWIQSTDFTIERMNFIIVGEVVEKAHLAAMTALLRGRRWADAACLMYEQENFLGWAAAFRGLLECAGDTRDGLYHLPGALARRHRGIAQFLDGKSDAVIDATEFENPLDHFVHAKWMRAKRGEENMLKAKENIDYIRNLDAAIPDVTRLYQRLSSICHPSQASLNCFFHSNPGGSIKLIPWSGAAAIAAFYAEYPDALFQAIQAHCIPPLLILRVLHKFMIHPQFAVLKRVDWEQIQMAAEIERYLAN
jgi:hypothetical protein